MKLHEIEWVDGKEYTIEILGITRNIKISSGDLCDSHTGKLLTDLYSVLGLLDADFKEVIKPVTFIEAYNDCLVSGNQYISEYNNYKLRRGRLSKQVELQCLESMDRVSAILIGEVTWTKVVE